MTKTESVQIFWFPFCRKKTFLKKELTYSVVFGGICPHNNIIPYHTSYQCNAYNFFFYFIFFTLWNAFVRVLSVSISFNDSDCLTCVSVHTQGHLSSAWGQLVLATAVPDESPACLEPDLHLWVDFHLDLFVTLTLHYVLSAW